MGKKPVILTLAYYQCPMLCNMVLNGELHAMRNIPFELGRDYDAITVSFDPFLRRRELAAEKKATYAGTLSALAATSRCEDPMAFSDGQRSRGFDHSQFLVGFRYALG